jgi:hypothetical protein
MKTITRNIKQKFLYAISIGVSIFLLFFVITCSWIGYEVKDQCQEAKRQYGNDCVESLIKLLKDDNNNYKSRNDAIWALGQLGDSRALSTLQSFYTGVIPEREPLDKNISQYELKKAIRLAEGGFNMSAIVWRIGF